MRHRIDLNGEWRLWYCDPGGGEARGVPAQGCPETESYVSCVPGDAHLDMIRAGVIEEPLYGRNALDCRWMEEKDWWYSRTFDLSSENTGDRLELRFGGLDTTADVWLNGARVGQHNNQFVPYTIDVTGVVREGENLLVVRVDCGLRANRKDRSKYVHISNEPASGLPRMWMRKAQFSFGWDWAPRLLTCGIWRDVELRSYQAAALRGVFFQTALEEGSARVTVQIELEGFSSECRACELHIAMRDPNGVTYDRQMSVQLPPGRSLHSTDFLIEKPSLWWPRDYGEASLYDAVIEVVGECDVLDSQQMQYGLRTTELIQEPLPGDEGTSFTLAINGERVFCKGANWAPGDSIIARVDRGRYRALLQAAAEANINMLRVWGGGVYEDPRFYRMCDELGIMVWQDFPYACSMYPDDDVGFLGEAKREAEIAVRELRNHPCLVLWCGNNENQWIYQRQVLSGQDVQRHYGLKIYDEVLPEVCARLDPTRPYWQSSPWGGEDPNSETEGDRHHWNTFIGVVRDPEKRLDFRNFTDDRGKFISEFGTMSALSPHSLRRFMPEDEMYVGSPAWDFHNNTFERGMLTDALRFYWGDPETLSLDQWTSGTQVIQAEALRFALEHFRRRKFLCSGALFWMLHDAWGTTASWSIVDYYLERKPSYYAVRHAFAPVLMSFKEGRDGGLSLWLTNGTLETIPGRVEYGLLDTVTGEWNRLVVDTEARANASSKVADVLIPVLDDEASSRSLVLARFFASSREISRGRHLLTGFRFQDLRLAPARVEYLLSEVAEDEFICQVSADRYALMVHFEHDAPESIWCEDNWFDLWPGEQIGVRLRGPHRAMKTLRVLALNQEGSAC